MPKLMDTAFVDIYGQFLRCQIKGFEDAFSKLQNGLAGKILIYPNGLGK